MADFEFNDPLAMKLWAKKISAEMVSATDILKISGEDDTAIVQLKNETAKSNGDAVTFGLRAKLIGSGVSQNHVLEGYEEKLSFASDTLKINELVHGVRVKYEGTIDAQRVPFSLRKQASDALVDWYSERLSLMAHLHLGGYTGSSITLSGAKISVDSKLTGFNTVAAPSKSKWILAGNKSKESALSADNSSDLFNLEMIDQAVELAKTTNSPFKPTRVGSDRVMVMYLHPKQVTSLRSNTDKGQWLDIQKAVFAASREKNPIFDGSLGMYNGVVLREALHAVPGLGDKNEELTNVRRAVLLGAQAGALAFGMANSDGKYKLVEELFDYRRELGIACKTILGFKKTQFNNEDFAVITVSSAVK